MEKYFVKRIEDKLMLCSRDIKVGDDIWFTGLGGSLKQAKFYHLCKNVEGEDVVDITEHGECTGFLLGSDGFKVIGEISPEATWLGEGSELDEIETLIVYGVSVKKSFRGGEINKIITFITDPTNTELITESIEDWAADDPAGMNTGYSLIYDATKVFIRSIKIKCPTCRHFH